MQIALASITVADQEAALRFYMMIQRHRCRISAPEGKGVQFRSDPQSLGLIISAVFEDTCGNLINRAQPAA